MKKQKSQTKVVLEYLKAHSHLTSIEAFENWHITRLADVVYKLRKRGHDIETITCNGVNDFGAYTYAEYRLIGEANGN